MSRRWCCYDALTLFANQKSPAKDPALDAALARVKPYAAVVDWRAPTVTFPGVDPLTPAYTGNPAGAVAIGPLADPHYAVSLAGDYLD